MEKIEELKKKIHCEECHEKYSEEWKPFVHDQCEHHTCPSCLKYDPYSYNGGYQCPICGVQTRTTEIPFASDVSIAVEIYESSMTSRDKEKSFLRKEILKLKQEREQLEIEKMHECAECGTTDSEHKMYLCGTCTKLEVGNVDSPDYKKHCLCSKCITKNHMREGHKTVDFFPWLSVTQYLNDYNHIDPKRKTYQTSENTLKESMTNLKELSQRATKNFEVLSDMARRSKSSKYQIEAMEKMEKFIDESNAVNLKMDSEWKEHTKSVQENLTNLEDWCTTRTDTCVDDSETIPLPCAIL